MELHLSAGVPDWDEVPAAQRNTWQRVATASRGSVTPGNLTSFIGVLLVLAGLWAMWRQQYWLGLGMIAAGRLCDLLDGVVAHKTGTKSPLGEATDASCDKIGAFATLSIFGAAGLLWWPAALAIGLQNGANTVIALIGKQRKYRLSPLRIGKLATAGEWIALLGFAFAGALGLDHLSGLGIASYVLLGAALILGSVATAGYGRLFWMQRPQRGPQQ